LRMPNITCILLIIINRPGRLTMESLKGIDF
jgi:hypothetical protein